MNIVLKDVSKSYNGAAALKNCSAMISKGIINAVIGPNGSGKSTMVRIASLLEPADSGEVRYGGSHAEPQNDISFRRKIAVVLPGDSLFNDTVFNNLAYGLKIRKMKKALIRERVTELLEKFQLSDKSYSSIRTLSSGEAQRVAVARALAVKPQYLFLDEPTASLDPVNTGIIENVLHGVNTERGITILMVTHNMFQAGRIAGRIIFMYGGRVIEESGSSEFFANPGHEITRNFLNGKMVW
ncbi:glutamine transport ATP-binding protein GlnQ [bacterium BMS3Abin07]|nr:glutamine transport ATP-binding protein GlnQ [bacterium BMS3Abin07]GBE32397.1 glutamine transport ATP-binding protein GlnQ [bacterium BMS3Bbin05]HDO21831.1 amino acid ABC transporter ATP-binding protein [Nitrospirota bacterium]HDZ88704.1 amino acid ABC transporter ATP-binding protein [Nitrospirota bacterium]